MPWTGCVTWPQECPSCAHRPWGVGKLTLLLYHVKISAQTGYLYSVGSPLQCSCLENPRDRGAWWAAVYGVTQSRTRLKRRSSSSSSSSRHNSGQGNGTPLQYSCLEYPMNGGAWWAAVHGVPKSRTGLRDFTFTFHFHALEKEMATHSSVLAWRVPGTGAPVGLPSMGSHRVGHDWSDLEAAAAGATHAPCEEAWKTAHAPAALVL